MNKAELVALLVCFVVLLIQAKAYSANDYNVQTLSIGGDEKVEDATNIQNFKKEVIPGNNQKPITGSVNDTDYLSSNPYYAPNYNNYYTYPTTVIYRTGVPYYTYGTPSYRISQPAYVNGLGYNGMGAGMSFNYSGHNFNYGFSSGNGMYASRTIPYNPPPPPPPCCNHHYNGQGNHHGQGHPPGTPGQFGPPPVINLPSNVIYKR